MISFTVKIISKHVDVLEVQALRSRKANFIFNLIQMR